MKEENKQIIKKLIFSALVILLVVLVGYFLLKHFGIIGMTGEEVRDLVASTGAVAPLVYIFISFIQVTFIPIPAAVTIVAGNYLFGPWLAFLYSYIGMIIGSVVAFWLGRKIGRPFINWIAGSSEKADEWINKLKGREKVLLFFMFLLPFFPDDILCSIAGILPITWFAFMCMQFITRITSIGCTIIFMSGEFIPYHGWGLVALGVIAVICITAFIYSMKYADKINDFCVKIADKILGKNKKQKENINCENEQK